MSPHEPPPKFAFYVNKPKAAMLAELFAEGAKAEGFECVITNRLKVPIPGHIGVFYGIVNDTYPAFRYYMADQRAVYLDNGWLSTPAVPTFRFSWNSIQPFLRDLAPTRRMKFPDLPEITRKPQRDLALLVLQSRQYFEYVRLPYSRDVWERATTRLLTAHGYRVEAREKPTKKDPEAETIFDQLSRAGIVVSLNSATTIKALRYGIPAYCTLDCTLSPYAPVKLPKVGFAAPPRPEEVEDLLLRLSRYEVTKRQLSTGDAIHTMLAVRPAHRRGYWYSGTQ